MDGDEKRKEEGVHKFTHPVVFNDGSNLLQGQKCEVLE